MKNFKILLIGQPNIGKSSLLNALVGSKVVISNYPGTTVEITEGEKIFDKIKMLFKDTPGIYSISDRSEEEKITEKALFEEKIDGAIIIVDSSSLERSLYIVLQVLEAHIPVIIALNFIEDARNKGIKIDYEKLEKILNVSVIPINPSVRSIIDIGGMDAKFVALDKEREVINFGMNSSCASGTGSFLDQQARRLELDIKEEFAKEALKSTNPARLAGRCAVFAKSDMIHLQQRQLPIKTSLWVFVRL